MKFSMLLLLIPACTFISDADVNAKFASGDDTAGDPDDADDDGYGLSVDCDDTDPSVHPDATEVWYDGVDQDCDGASDFDQDADGYDSSSWPNTDGVYGDDCYDEVDSDCAAYDGAEADCSYPVSGPLQGDPIDPFDIHPAATDTWYDGTDQDCGGNDDFDQDGDGFASYAECDDTDPTVYPNPEIPEVWYNGIDENCDGNDGDQDGDAFLDAGYSGGYVHDAGYYSNGDCWDDPADGSDWLPINGFPSLSADDVNPGADETWYDSLDQDCAGDGDFDQDADAYETDAYPDASGTYGDDCDDLTRDTNPGAADTWYDGIDSDCAANDDFDQDGDGYGQDGSGLGDDCDDTRSAVNAGANEACSTIYDDDCDGLTNDPDALGCTDYYADADTDDFGDAGLCLCETEGLYTAEQAGDCDDLDALVNPDAEDPDVDGIDQDCDGADGFSDYPTAWGSEMTAISAGTFSMGSGNGDSGGAYTDHTVTLTHDFWIGQTEVTQAEWAAWSGSFDTTPSDHAGCDTCPVEQVSWTDSALYANALSAEAHLTPCYLADGSDVAAAYIADPYSCPGYRLPTEAEWEYAARAGENTTYAGSDVANEVAWTETNAGGASHTVCTLATNAWGLCDMSGNVYEWTNDWYSASYDGYGDGSASVDPPGPSSGSNPAFRGGGWYVVPEYSCVAYRRYDAFRTDRSFVVGFRLARSFEL